MEKRHRSDAKQNGQSYMDGQAHASCIRVGATRAAVRYQKLEGAWNRLVHDWLRGSMHSGLRSDSVNIAWKFNNL